MRGCQHDGLHALVGERLLQVVAEREAISLRDGQGRVDLLADAVHEAKLLAPALDALDDVLAPPAQPDDRGVDHLSPARFFSLTALLTTFTGHSPASRRRTSLGAPACKPTIAVSLYQATWGLRITFSRPRNGWGSGSGSGSTVSRAQPAILFASSARTRASVSTTGPREQLMRMAVGFMREKASSLIILRVSGVRGGCTDTKSASWSSVFSSVFLPGSLNCPSLTKGSA